MILPELIQGLSEDGLLESDSYEAAIDLMKAEKLRENIGGKYVFNQGKLERVLEASENLSEQEKATYSILISLSKRERQCFLKNSIENKSFRKIADELGVSKGAVQQYIERARKKIAEKVNRT